jgi:hypothetical protein
MRLLVAGLLSAISVVTTAPAAERLASGEIFGADRQDVGVCYLINLGSTGVTLQSVGIYLHDDNSHPLTAVSNNCYAGTILAAGKTCRTVSDISRAYYVCRAIVGSKTNIRGDFQERVGSVTVAHQSLR